MIHILDTFTTYQGTGHLLGTRQHFIRFAGCSVAHCPIREQCDEPRALTRAQAQQVDPKELVLDAVAAVGERGWLHITGGEPTDQSDGLQELVQHARKVGLYVHLQTSGIRRVPIQWDWLTVSPKIRQPLQTFGQELIVVDDGTVTVEWLHELVATTKFWTYYLLPLWGRPMQDTVALAQRAGDPWMLTCQLHKIGGFQ